MVRIFFNLIDGDSETPLLGGAVGLLALNALFMLMKDYNL